MFTSVTNKQSWLRKETDSSAAVYDPLKTGMRYLIASIFIAAAAAAYGLFSHSVYSYYMTYAFMVPLLAGALPHLAAAMKRASGPIGGTEAEDAANYEDDAKGANYVGVVDAVNVASAVDAANVANAADTASVARGIAAKVLSCAPDMQLAFVATLTAGSLLKGALDIYGTTNKLMIVYPAAAVIMLAAYAAALAKGKMTAEKQAS